MSAETPFLTPQRLSLLILHTSASLRRCAASNSPLPTSKPRLPTMTLTTPAESRRSTTTPSPSDSFYAMSDDEEGAYNTITHTESGKGVKLLFSKSKVRLSSTLSTPADRSSLTLVSRCTSTLRHPQKTTSRAILLFSNKKRPPAAGRPRHPR